MGIRWNVFALLSVLIFTSDCALGHGGEQQEGLELSGPREVFRSDGGTVEEWSPDYRVLQDANVDATRVTIEQRGLALLQYSDSPQITYVLEGEAKVGLSYPWEQTEHVRNVKPGDVIAIPRGVGHWWYNGAENRFVILIVADTLDAVKRGDHENFYLHGGSDKPSKLGSVLGRFDLGLLSDALDVDTKVVQQLIESQKGTVIVKLNEDLNIPTTSVRGDESVQWENFSYNIDEEEADIRVENGGSFTLLTKRSFSILRELHLTVIRVRLEAGALFAPSYITNAHTVLYVTKGSGRIQVVDSEQQLLDANIKQGSLVVIPQSHPDIKKAGDEGFEFIAIATSDSPIFSFLAGKNAIYRNVPVGVLAAGNNVAIDVEQQIRDRRQNDAVIFPFRGNSGFFGVAGAIKKLNSIFFDEELQETLKKVHI